MKKINFNIKFNPKIGIFTLTSLFFLYLLYLSIPSLYDSGRVQKDLNNKIVDEFGFNLSLSSEISYRILPQPHFHVKDSKILGKNKIAEEIGEIKDIKIFINQRNLLKKQDINIKQIVFSKGNFFINRENFSFIINLLNDEFSKKKLIIKKSKLFFNDKNSNIIFIYSIDSLNLFKNIKKKNQGIKTKGSIFKIPVKFYWEKNLENKKTISNFKADKLAIDFQNKGNFQNEEYIYDNNLNILTSNFKTNYKISKNKIELKSQKSLIKNTPISYFGNIDLSPFSFQIHINAKEIDLEYFFKNTFFLNEIVSSNILLNQNINGILKIETEKLNKNKFFNSAQVNVNFEEGYFNFNNSYAINNKFAKITANNIKFEEINATSYLNGNIFLDIFNKNQFFKFFPISKKKRFKRNFDKIKFYFTFNLNNSKFSINRINFFDKQNKIIQSKNVDDFVEDNFETRFNYSNSVLFKNYLKKVINAYLEEG